MKVQNKSHYLATLLAGAAFISAIGASRADDFAISAGTLAAALDNYAAKTGVDIVVSAEALKGIRTKGATGTMSREEALTRLLRGTGFVAQREDQAIAIVRSSSPHTELVPIEMNPIQIAQASPSRAVVETVTVTSSKLGGADVQSIPIAITALSQEQLTATQTAGGPDLVKQVPNLTFTKTNFTGYSIQIRGIGTQAISVTTDPAVAVAFNDVPFIRNHFFEQEFYDLGQVEVLRGPQGTLYGRNATAGVVNLVSAKPTDQFEAMASAELGNYHQRRFEGMINLPIVDDWLDIRLAGEWTKRQGYSFNELTNQRIDGRDLWSGRLTIGWKPIRDVQAYLVWEHFYENDDRLRSGKQLCKTAPSIHVVNGVDVGDDNANALSQGCLPASLYSADAFEVPNGHSLAYFSALPQPQVPIDSSIDPYASTVQSRNLRVIQSTLDPVYKAKNDMVELNVDYNITPSLTLTSQTGFNNDFIYSSEDFNRFNTVPGIFTPDADGLNRITPDGYFCDPQLGCSNRLVAQDLSDEHAWQLSQEFRLTSNFDGPLNFSVGGNFLHYETEENYYVFINTLTLFAADGNSAGNNNIPPWVPGVSDNHECLLRARSSGSNGGWYQYPDLNIEAVVLGCKYIDPNPLGQLNNKGHNYFLSQNPYVLSSYAGFGELYYNIFKELKLIGGLRWTEDRKHFPLMPSWLVAGGYGYPVTGVVDQQWNELTGRAALNWTPQLDFTDQTLIYGSYAHGYKAGGANPPGAKLLSILVQPEHPLTFKPEFVDAFELGTKNTMLDGALTLNASAFYYNYENYQISQIVDRTSVNLNFDAHITGAEVEAAWEPLPGLRFNFAGGYEHTSLAKGSKAIDLMDRTGGHSDWLVVKPAPTQASNCILPKYVIATGVGFSNGGNQDGICYFTYVDQVDPVTNQSYVADPFPGYAGFDPASAPNSGAGFDKDLSGNELPNSPPFTISAGAQYTIPVSADWAATLRSDYYWQDYSWARVFNDNPYDRLRGYTNLNLALILTSQSGWQVMLYDKNVFDTTAITGDFLNSDDTALTTNVFLTDPKLIGVRVTKNW